MAARRKKRKTSRRRSKRSDGGRFGAMLFGLFAGLAIAGGVWYATLPESQTAVVKTDSSDDRPAQETKPARASKPVPIEATGTGYDFYDMLPEQVVVVTDDFAARRKSPQQEPAAASVPLDQPASHVIQAGSFRSSADAESMKATLLLRGIPARIETVEIRDRVYHRIRVGPIRDPSELNDYLLRLRAADIDVQLIRIDG